MLGGAKNIVCNIKQCFFDIIFPKYCVICEKEGSYFCEVCQTKDILTWDKNCFKCHNNVADLSLCEDCKSLYFFDGLLCASDYEDRIISSLIQAYKYHFVKELAQILGLFIAKHLEKELMVSKNIFFNNFFDATVIAVPLSKRRQKWRGFNQAEVIAKVVAQYFGLNFNSDLRRLIHKKPQAKLSEAKRLNNLQGCFNFNGTAPAKVILVDDVITTAATVNECAKVLRAQGAEEILVLAIAKG
ncbi:MAG: hypothetical protein NTY12_04005 [Candidatus Falkowbacteria bacterium]|nr:hypothetical protein [Candidatus Falkowbacteria bacterium]